MSSAGDMREGDVFLTLSPARYPWELVVNKATNSRPRSTPEGSIVVKVNVRVPKAAFLPITPEVVVTVTDDQVNHAVEVEPLDANEGTS